MKALVLENIHQSAVSVFESRGYEVETRTGALSEGGIVKSLHGVSLLGIRSNTTVTRRVLEESHTLRRSGASASAPPGGPGHRAGTCR